MMQRVVKPSYFRIFTCYRTSSRNFCESKDDGKNNSKLNDDKNNKKSKTPEKNANAANERLNKLLADMSTVEKVTLKKSVEIPKAPKKRNKKQIKAESSSDEDEKRPKNVFEAAKKVAETMEGDQKQTEMELLSKLLGIPLKNEREEKSNLNDVISGMQITKDDLKPNQTRADFVRRSVQQNDKRTGDRQSFQRDREPRQERRPRAVDPSRTITKIELFGAEPLGIFSKTSKAPTEFCETWDYLEKRELRLSVTHPPSNYFEKMALWTEQGKLWRFPIDNEQDIGPESEVDFTEHIFLEEQLEPWCPKKGPIRHFMELVTVGLSKNPYLSVQEKHDHINYYKEYFGSKKELLKQIIVESEKPKEVASN